MKWFKFYGQDFLTDSKLGGLNPFQRLMWVTLLCIASQDDQKTGILKFFDESRLVALSGLSYDDMESMYGLKRNVTLETFCNMGLVTRIDKNTILITNYQKKQTQQATSTERVSKWRAKNKDKIKSGATSDVTLHETDVTLHSNGRIDKNRIDINDNSQAKLSSPSENESKEETTEVEDYRIDMDTDEDGNPLVDSLGRSKNKKPKETKSNQKDVYMRILKKFMDLAQKNVGTRPINDLSAFALIKYAMNTGELTEEKIYRLFDDWFLSNKRPDQLIHIRQALSRHNINNWKIENPK